MSLLPYASAACPVACRLSVPSNVGLNGDAYAMTTAEHREPCESRGSCTVLGAPGGGISPGDSTDTVDETANTRSTYLTAI
jgi:hypothetical protein